MARRVWFERRFELGLPAIAFPEVWERVRGTPARLEERVGSLPGSLLVRRIEDSWTIQENVGHLLDLEPLWTGRLDDLLNGNPDLRPADLLNRKTHEARHNRKSIRELLAGFRSARMEIVRRLDELSEPSLLRTSLHPRLEQPMTIVDLFFFVAEHDDHHLARITQLLRSD